MRFLTNKRIPRIGGRIWKTGIAITLSLIVSRLFHIPEPVFTAIVAIIGVQPTVVQSFKYGVEQVLAVVLGAIVALGVLALLAYYPDPVVRAIAVGGATVFVMWLCLLLRWYDALVLAACTVTVVMILGQVGANTVAYSVDRLLATVVGTVVAVVVNTVMVWPSPRSQFPKRLPEIAEQAFEEFEEAVSIFCRRDLDAARRAIKAWHRRKMAFDLAAAELSWFQESRFVKQLIPFRRRELAPVFSETYSIIDSIHQSAFRMLRDTVYSLEEHPDHLEQDARVYVVIEDALQSPSALKKAIVDSLATGDSSPLREVDYDWRLELHGRVMGAMRTSYRTSRDIFPVFEVANVGVEVRNYTRFLASLRRLILHNEHLLSKLHAQR